MPGGGRLLLRPGEGAPRLPETALLGVLYSEIRVSAASLAPSSALAMPLKAMCSGEGVRGGLPCLGSLQWGRDPAMWTAQE